MGECFDDDADMDMVKAAFIKKVDAYYLPLLERAEKAIANGHIQWKNDAEGYKKRMQEARDNPIVRYDAYESVQIFFNQKPSQELIDFMKQRAQKFAETQEIGYKGEHCKILGFRLSESITKMTTASI